MPQNVLLWHREAALSLSAHTKNFILRSNKKKIQINAFSDKMYRYTEKQTVSRTLKGSNLHWSLISKRSLHYKTIS